MKKPDKDYVASYLKEKRKEYNERDRVDDRMYSLYHGDYQPELPPHVQADPIKTGYATQFIDRVMGIFTHEKPSVSMTPAGFGDEAIKRTSKNEEFLNCLFPAMQQEAGEPTWHHVTQDTLLYGRGLSVMPPAYSIYWKDYPKQDEDEDDKGYNDRTEEWKKGNRLPLAWRHVPSIKSYPDWDDYGLAEIATVEKRSLRRLMNDYEEKQSFLKKRFGDHPDADLTLIKYANRDWLTYFVDGKDSTGTPELLRRIEHKCGMSPYVLIRGKSSSSPRPEHATKSLLYHMENLILYLEKLLIQKGTAIRIWCWPQLVRKSRVDTPLGDDGNPLRRDLQLSPGETIELLEGEDISFLVWTGNAPDIDEQIATIQRYIDRMGLASVMYGTTASDASSGYAINTLIQAAQSLFGPIAQHLSDGYRDLNRLALKHVELLGQTVYVYRKIEQKGGWISLAPSDIKGYYYMEGVVEATLPQELPVNAQIALQLTQGEQPLMDMYSARTKLLKDKSPDKTDARILLEKWKRSPEMQQFYTQKVIELAGAKIDQLEAQGAQLQGPVAPALAGLLGQPGLAGPGMAAPGGMMGQATVPMQPGIGLPTMATPQAPGPQAQVNAADRTLGVAGGRRPGAARQPGGPRQGQGVVP